MLPYVILMFPPDGVSFIAGACPTDKNIIYLIKNNLPLY
jgi:hypothetical protein